MFDYIEKDIYMIKDDTTTVRASTPMLIMSNY